MDGGGLMPHDGRWPWRTPDSKRRTRRRRKPWRVRKSADAERRHAGSIPARGTSPIAMHATVAIALSPAGQAPDGARPQGATAQVPGAARASWGRRSASLRAPRRAWPRCSSARCSSRRLACRPRTRSDRACASHTSAAPRSLRTIGSLRRADRGNGCGSSRAASPVRARVAGDDAHRGRGALQRRAEVRREQASSWTHATRVCCPVP